MKKSVRLIVIISTLNSPDVIATNEAPWVGFDLDGIRCKTEGQGFGPYDYRTGTGRPIVEKHHFDPDIEFLRQGNRAGNIPSNLDYTLRAIPNHHRALLSAIRLQLKANKKITKMRLRTPVECYLQRALNFRSNDSTVYFLYGYYLHKLGHLEKAQEMFEKSLEYSPDSIKIQYAYGLLLIDMKQYDKASEYAKKIYSQGNFHPGLRNKLKKLGFWKELKEPSNK